MVAGDIMIYRKVENPSCRLCAHSDTPCSGNVYCSIKGVVPADYLCKKFKYDIFKRPIKPKKKKNNFKFCEKDFMI